jgi:2-phosphosulfolactate phosphatase
VKRIDALLSPADIREWAGQDKSGAACVVFDVFRATSTLLAALAAGASGIHPADDIGSALSIAEGLENPVLAGERGGLRIGPELTGGRAFDLGNSPREILPEAVAGRPFVQTTTNGTRALHACRGADFVLAASFANLGATGRWLRARRLDRIVLVAAGTGEQGALEDTLGAGALAELLLPFPDDARIDDAVVSALTVWRAAAGNLETFAAQGRNGRRLGKIGLADDVGWCLTRDRYDFAAVADERGVLRCVTP